jgi:PAS domain S-box-containing protein
MNNWRAIVVLLIGLVLTGVITESFHRNVETKSYEDFLSISNEISHRISVRMKAHEQLLKTASAYFEASDSITRKEWKDFIEHAELFKDLPGIQGIGYSVIIPANKLKDYTQRIRKEGFSSFNVFPEGESEIYTSLTYIEPFKSPNDKAFGYNMYSDSIRKKAMEFSRDSDEASVTGKISLIQMTGNIPGIVMYYPVYRNGMPTETVEDRRKAIMGWISSSYRMDYLMGDVLGRWDLIDPGRIHLRIFDSTVSSGSLLFDSQKGEEHSSKNPLDYVSLPFVLKGTEWILVIDRVKEEMTFQSSEVIVFICGIIITFLLFTLSVSLLNTTQRATAMANDLTKELKEKEERYRLIAENINDVIWLYNIDRRKFTYVSPSVTMLSGFSIEEALNHSIEDSLSPESAGKIRKMIPEAYDEFLKNPGVKTHYYNELLQRCKNGGFTWVETITQFQYSTDMEVEVLGVSRNIEQRKRNERQLRENEEKFRKVVETLPSLLTITGINGRITYISPNCESFTGYTSEEAPDDNLFWVHPDDADYVGQFFSESQIAENYNHNIEYKAIKRNGDIWFAHSSWESLKNSEGALMGIIIQTMDFSEIRCAEDALIESEKKLRESNKTKDKLFSIIAHDLRNPFSSIIGFSEILATNIGNQETEKSIRQAGYIKSSAEQSLVMLENLLQWARTQTGQMDFKPEMHEIRPFVQKIIDVLRISAKVKKIKIVNEVPDGIMVLADRNMLDVVLRNLISNSIKFTNQGGNVIIRSKLNYKEVELSVADEGIGMDKDILDKIFSIDPGQVRVGTADERGSGLGLVLCKEFISKAGGHIRVESEPGHGSMFTVILPMGANMTFRL